MADATDTAWAQGQTPASKHRTEQWEILEEMVSEEGGQLFDFAPKHVTAIEWGMAEINRLLTENAVLKWGRQS